MNALGWWRSRRGRWWLVPLVFLLLNATALSMYRVVYAGRIGLLRAQLVSRSEELDRLQHQRAAAAEHLERAERSRQGIAELYRDRFATESERLTGVIGEVKSLAQRAGLAPGAISYPEEVLEDHGLVKKSIVFSVEGSYVSLRKLINFLELSESFLVLEGIRVSDAEPNLSISLTISTLFSRPMVRPTSARRPSAGGERGR